ncbi:MAG: HlyD family secretion protein [Treponema sp.]|jgi:adhesin transport system membrane fusion protein|nr:HlyD family secretion protein [Treponema sp.]
MIKFSNLEEFQLGYQFFMTKPSPAVKMFIFIITCVLVVALIWASIAKMDEIVKATVFLRPIETISIIKPLTGGQIQQKNYIHNEYVKKGDLLFKLDTSADFLELQNSKELMERIKNNIYIYTALIETIKRNTNTVSKNNEEAYLHSEKYILENRRQSLQIDEMRKKLETEKNTPEMLLVKQKIDDMKGDLERTELQFALWKNSKATETKDILENLIQSKENLERRMADLDRNIRNGTIYSPISGRINELRKLNIGDYIVPCEEILTIVPDNETGLKAELYIEPAYIARVKTGQKAVLRFPGLPPSKYGKIEAEINLIPADYNIVQDATPYFIVEAKIKEPWLISREGEKMYLRVGIGATGRIVIDRDTILRMILKKLDFINEDYTKKVLNEEN